jgi:hypothetical protein
MKILKHTLSRKTLFSYQTIREDTNQPIEMPLDNNSRTRIKSVRPIRIQKAPY